jgi:predicted dinucleotide-binding enzyme
MEGSAMRKIVILLAVWMLAPSSTLAEESHTIAIIGTGNMARALGPNLSEVGHKVIYGSRNPGRAKIADLVEVTGADSVATTQRDAAEEANIIILAVPWEAVEALIPNLGDLSGKIVIDITTGDRQGADGYPELAVETSTSEMIQGWAPRARIVKTPFAGAGTVQKQLRAEHPIVTFLAADDREAKEMVARLAIQLNFFPLDAGPLRMARTIDHLGLLFLTPLVQKRNVIFGSSGVPELRLELSCVSKEGWFEPVYDADNLASFPNLEKVDIQCPGIESGR